MVPKTHFRFVRLSVLPIAILILVEAEFDLGNSALGVRLRYFHLQTKAHIFV